MIKRLIALALTILFICFKCLTWVPSAAATGIPAFDAFYYAILQTLGMAYTNGVEMDLAPAIAEVRENIPDYLQQPDNAVKYLLRNYASQLWDNSILQWSDSADEPAVVANLSAIRLAGTEVSTPTLKDIVAQYQKKALDTDYQITTPINTDAIAFWNKYDSLYINQYLDKVNHVDQDIVQPTPDIDYMNSLEYINGTGFFFEGWGFNTLYPQYTNIPLTLIPVSSYSWCVFPESGINSNTIMSNNDSNFWISNTCNLTSVYITSSGGNYTYTYSGTCPYNFTYFGRSYNSAQYRIAAGDYYVTAGYTNIGNYTYTSSTFNSLSALFDDLKHMVKNVNIYVDGVLWSTVEDTITSNFNSTVPNAVIDSSTDDGKIVSNPIYWTVDENTGTPIDAQINLDKLIDYLKGVIDGSNSDTSVDYGDLVDAGVIEKQDGTAITDANVIAVPVADAIDDALADNPAITEPIVAIEDLPPLPPLPPFFPTPDFPEGDPTSGFNGMSVLARIINITNQSLPSEVVLVFYGVVFGAVILGLIKILHK